MDEDIVEKAEAYVARPTSPGRSLAWWGGWASEFTVSFLREGNAHPGVAALKILSATRPYLREKEVYGRLKEEGIIEIRAFRVPQLIALDDEFLALEMTVVKPPFVLDFAGAYLDFAPEFSDEIWAEWTRKNEEQFGSDWPMAQSILAGLEDLGIHMHDPSPSNIRFR